MNGGADIGRAGATPSHYFVGGVDEGVPSGGGSLPICGLCARPGGEPKRAGCQREGGGVSGRPDREGKVQISAEFGQKRRVGQLTETCFACLFTLQSINI